MPDTNNQRAREMGNIAEHAHMKSAVSHTTNATLSAHEQSKAAEEHAAEAERLAEAKKGRG